MKAKEYYQKLITQNIDQSIQSIENRVIIIIHQMAVEMNDIIKLRNAKTESAIFSIMKEQNQKCNSFIRMVNMNDNFCTIKEDAFLIYIEQTNDNLYEMYKKHFGL